MREFTVRDATGADFPTILALNEEFVEYLSPLDEERLALLGDMAAYFKVIDLGGKVAGFMLAFAKGSAYDSTNYQWFNQSYDRFLYIDRVVIAADQQGRKFGRLFYDHLAAYAQEHNIPILSCEYNIEPMNEGSAKFHKSYGFKEVGRKESGGGTTIVSLQTCAVNL